MKNMLLLVLIFIAGCTSTTIKESAERRPIDEVFQGATVNKYYLTDLPLWANFSHQGQCRRDKQIRFLNFTNLSSSFGFSYEELVQFQLMLNNRLESYLAGQELEALRAKDESYIFYNVQDQIKAGAKEFQKNDYKKVLVIWIDHIVDNKAEQKSLIQLLNSPKVEDRQPILASICMTKREMELFLKEKLKISDGPQIISAEMFSPYKNSTELGYGYYLDLKNFFGKDYDFEVIHFSELKTDVFGDVKLKHYK